MIGQYPTVRSENAGFQHWKVMVSQDGVYDVNLWVLCTFLHGEWLCASAIDGAILPQIKVASHGIQYMSIQIGQHMLANLRQNVAVANALVLKLSTERIVIPLNVCNNHWCLAMAECVNRRRSITVYNSAPSIGIDELRRNLPWLVDCIVDKNPLSLWKDSSWSSQQILFAPAAIQHDSYNCGIYTIHNAIALMQRQDPLQHIDNINDLRTNYARIFMAGLQDGP